MAPDAGLPKTDHFSIIITLDQQLDFITLPSCRNFRRVEWDKFNKMLGNKFRSLPPPQHFHHAEDAHKLSY
jgi:hypothetical protein